MKTAFVLALVSSMLALGCELIVDFDRTKIVGEEVPETGAADTSTPTGDATTGDTGTDAPADTGTTDAADAAPDVTDAAVDG